VINLTGSLLVSFSVQIISYRTVFTSVIISQRWQTI